MTLIKEFLIKRSEYFFFSYLLLAALLIPVTLYLGGKALVPALVAPMFFIFLFDNIDSYFKVSFLASMFLYYYLSVEYRIQLINIYSYALILFFITNQGKDFFNASVLPKPVKVASICLITAVWLSSINSPFLGVESLYYAVMFTTYIVTGYIVFRTIKTFQDLDEFLTLLPKVVAFYGIIIIFNIAITGIIRSRGLTGSAFSDIIVTSLVVSLFRNVFLAKFRFINIAVTFVLLVILVTDLSRFAWVGFMLSFLYGMFLMTKFFKSDFIRNRLKIVLVVTLLGFGFFFISGLYSIVAQRFSDVSFTILKGDEGKDVVGNSLDTRGLIWITALNAFTNNPATGVGYFMFHSVSDKYNVLPEELYFEYVDGLDAHSTAMNFLCETGLVGFSSLFLLFTIVFFLSYKAIKLSTTFEEKSRSLVLNILVFFVITTSIYSGAFTFGYNGYYLYFVFAIVVANFYLLKKKYRLT